MPIATIRSPMATGICRSETRGTVNTVSVNGMFRRKATMLKNANGMIRYMTLGSSRERSIAKRQARAAPRHAKFRARATKLKLGRQRPPPSRESEQDLRPRGDAQGSRQGHPGHQRGLADWPPLSGPGGMLV